MQEHRRAGRGAGRQAGVPTPDKAGAVVVIGAGLVGLPAGLVFALAGYTVRLVDVDDGRRAVRARARRLAASLSWSSTGWSTRRRPRRPGRA